MMNELFTFILLDIWIGSAARLGRGYLRV